MTSSDDEKWKKEDKPTEAVGGREYSAWRTALTIVCFVTAIGILWNSLNNRVNIQRLQEELTALQFRCQANEENVNKYIKEQIEDLLQKVSYGSTCALLCNQA